MYQIYIVNSLFLLTKGFECSNEEFIGMAEESGTILSLKEFEELVNKEDFNRDYFTLRILKPTKNKS